LSRLIFSTVLFCYYLLKVRKNFKQIHLNTAFEGEKFRYVNDLSVTGRRPPKLLSFSFAVAAQLKVFPPATLRRRPSVCSPL
jgi:hypothetical protein